MQGVHEVTRVTLAYPSYLQGESLSKAEFQGIHCLMSGVGVRGGVMYRTFSH